MDRLIKHYEECFRLHGDNHRGVDWPNKQDIQTRYQVMIQATHFPQVFFDKKTSLLDFGCGLGHFYEYLESENLIDQFEYSGCDARFKMIQHCRNKFTDINFFLCETDGIKDSDKKFQYIICNEVFTEKRDYSFDEMVAYSTHLIDSLFALCTHGLAVNFMSPNVDWERDDLFHLPLDKISSFVSTNLTKHFIIHNDYALYEYTMYIYKRPLPNIFARVTA